jgi:hypothetical protein
MGKMTVYASFDQRCTAGGVQAIELQAGYLDTKAGTFDTTRLLPSLI